MARGINKKSINFRYNIATIFTYLIGIILIVQLFNLQIVHGAKYREESNTRLTRESVLEADRGEILDRSGNVLVSSSQKFNLELYKSKIDTDTLNESILKIIQVLEKYDVSYTDSFPININPFGYTISDTSLSNWKKNNNIDSDATAEEAFYKFKDKYKIKNEDITEVRKIIAIRYAIVKEGYSSTKALTIAKDIPREAIAEFSEKGDDFPGINIAVQPVRQYKEGTLASHILGYASKISDTEYQQKKDTYNQNDIIGKTGIEYLLEEYLKGKDGIKQIDMAVDGTITAEVVEKEAVSGSNVVLTIDSKLQKIAEEALKDNIEKIKSGGFGKAYEAKGGSCVVMNVKTGEVLAMASYPDYNPQSFANGISSEEWKSYSENKSYPLLNKAIQSAYEPGSIFKMVTAIAGLESGNITLTERINDTGQYIKYGEKRNCWYYTDYHTGHGPLNVIGAIEKSCNYFFYETADRMGIDTLDKYASYFGLGKKTGIELPSEVSGTLASKEYVKSINSSWNPGDTINAAIGQGYNRFTPLQMTKYISMIANGGNNVDVSIIKTIQNSDGTEVSKEEINKFVNEKLGLTEENNENINLNKDYINAVKEGMKSVTSGESGTAYVRFKDFNIKVGGKTGSAEAGKDSNGKDIVNAWFAAFAPYEDPEIAVVVMVENGGHGNYTAEAVRNIMAEYFGMNTQNVTESVQAEAYTESIR
ncbi:penicillin-binding protein 2 [Clostridium sp. CAG:389]|nr:penicillin-binding protein 2 [Clostridium sp. CAG:389]